MMIRIIIIMIILPLQAAPQPHQPPHPLPGCLRLPCGPSADASWNYFHRGLLVPGWPHVHLVLHFRFLSLPLLRLEIWCSYQLIIFWPFVTFYNTPPGLLCVCLCLSCSILYNSLMLKDFLRWPDLDTCYGECVVVLNYNTGAVDFVFTCIGPITVIICMYCLWWLCLRLVLCGPTLQLS